VQGDTGEKMSEFMTKSNLTLARIEEWLREMRGDTLIGKDIQELESREPDALRRVILVAVLSWKKFCDF
jgi:hypothetical protein